VVPVFNAENYLTECLESIRIQHADRTQLIVVNDGSTDRSAEVISTFAADNPWVTAVVQPNRGLGAARNQGISIATGDYIIFLDADDWLDIDALRKIRDFLQDNPIDLVMFDTKVHSERKYAFLSLLRAKRYYRRRPQSQRVVSGSALFESAVQARSWLPSACLFAVRKEVLTLANLYFREDSYMEDHAFTVQCALNSATAFHLPIQLHNRRIRSGSITTGAHELERYLGFIKAIADIRSINFETSSVGQSGVTKLLLRMMSVASMRAMSIPKSQISAEAFASLMGLQAEIAANTQGLKKTLVNLYRYIKNHSPTTKTS
jgi:glycosyltransferase involved in cell wall biosynthesis